MADTPSWIYLYRCFSASSAGALRCGLDQVGPRLSQLDLLSQFEQHIEVDQKNPTALVSTTDRPIEALHRAFVKYYNLDERAADIWIAFHSVPVGENGTLPCHRARDLALELGYSPKKGNKFMHEYIFEWEIERQYVKHMVSVETLLDRGLNLDAYLQNGRLPHLRGFRVLMVNMIRGLLGDGDSLGRELGRMAQCFGARAPVKEIARRLLTDCPEYISIDREGASVVWKGSGYEPVYFNYEDLGWVRDVDEALFDSWLGDIDFIEERIAHAEMVNELTSEMEMLWEFYREDLCLAEGYGINSDTAADGARELQSREREMHDLIERHAVSIGL